MFQDLLKDIRKIFTASGFITNPSESKSGSFYLQQRNKVVGQKLKSFLNEMRIFVIAYIVIILKGVILF